MSQMAMRFLTSKHIALMIALLGAVTVLTAIGFEHIGGYIPCPLCLIQRYPYYIGVPVALLAAWLLSKEAHRGIGLAVLGVVGLIFLTSFALGAYHTGVEWGFWEGPTTCAGAGLRSGSAADLMAALDNPRVVRCDEAPWHFLGLSFAGWNAVLSLALAGLAFFGVRQGAHEGAKQSA